MLSRTILSPSSYGRALGRSRGAIATTTTTTFGVATRRTASSSSGTAAAAAETKPPLPPYTRESAIRKIRMAEDAWNSRDPDRVKMAYSADSAWRNRSSFFAGRDEIRSFLKDKWDRELEYRLIKELWAYTDDRIAVRFCYEYRNEKGEWFRAHGNENWLFNERGLMKERHASINDVPITEGDRKFHWTTGQPRPLDHPGLSDLGL